MPVGRPFRRGPGPASALNPSPAPAAPRRARPPPVGAPPPRLGGRRGGGAGPEAGEGVRRALENPRLSNYFTADKGAPGAGAGEVDRRAAIRASGTGGGCGGTGGAPPLAPDASAGAATLWAPRDLSRRRTGAAGGQGLASRRARRDRHGPRRGAPGPPSGHWRGAGSLSLRPRLEEAEDEAWALPLGS